MIEGIVDSIFKVISAMTQLVRQLVESITTDYAVLVYLALAGVGGYFTARKFNTYTITTTAILIGVIYFLIIYLT